MPRQVDCHRRGKSLSYCGGPVFDAIRLRQRQLLSHPRLLLDIGWHGAHDPTRNYLNAVSSLEADVRRLELLRQASLPHGLYIAGHVLRLTQKDLLVEVGNSQSRLDQP